MLNTYNVYNEQLEIATLILVYVKHHIRIG